MSIIDVLTFKRSSTPYFTVNTSVASVEIVLPSSPLDTKVPMINSYGQAKFSRGDNFNLISLGLKLPLSFELVGEDALGGNPERMDMMCLSMVANVYGSGMFPVEHSLGSGQIIVPYENYELSINSFFNDPSVAFSGDFELVLWPHPYTYSGTAQNPKVSMLNVPSSLNGKKFYMSIFAKIEHNQTMKN